MERFGRQLYHFTKCYRNDDNCVVKGDAQSSEIDMLEVRRVSNL